ncbi:MAG: hypothetical protein KatS3mg087_1816 [Patescibacteria group bacterium]|nr:MAG: hypothetical protein KatS3mg087_1816 [Patescibacteria group bacterium]
MSTKYHVVLQDSIGNERLLVSEIINLSYARRLNSIGALTLEIPDIILPNQVTKDWRVIVWRTAENHQPYIDMNCFWLVESVSYNYDLETWTIKASDFLSILNRRIIAYTPETTYADKTIEELGTAIPADDMIKAYARENIGPLSLNPDRDLSEYIEIEADLSQGPLVEKKASFANLFSTFVEISRLSEELGTPLYFDFEPNGNRLVLRTFVYTYDVNTEEYSTRKVFYPGINLKNTIITWDYSQEVTRIYGGGAGSGAGRLILQRTNTERLDVSPWNIVEHFLDLGDTEFDETDYANDEMDQVIRARAPKMIIQSELINSEGSVYGIDYQYKDTVAINISGRRVPSIIEAVNVTYSPGSLEKERVIASIKGQMDIL